MAYEDDNAGVLKYATNASGAWATETIVDHGIDSAYPQIAVDSQGFVHVVFGSFAYACNRTGEWEVTNPVPYSSEWPAFALDGQGYAHIAYPDDANGSMNVTTDKTGEWVTELVDEFNSGYFHPCSLVVDAGGSVHVIYGIQNSPGFKYATNKSGAWIAEFINTEDVQLASIALDEDGFAHIVYHDDGHFDFRYATNRFGEWESFILDPSRNSGMTPAIAIGPGNMIHVTYWVYSVVIFASFPTGEL